MGKYEQDDRLVNGTLAIVDQVVKNIKEGNKVVIGGGDTAGFIKKYAK